MSIQDGKPAAPSTTAGREADITMQSEGFAEEAVPQNMREVVTAYISRVKAGELGALPAFLGLVVMIVIFGSATSVFLTRGNIANLTTQAAATALIAMGIVFVLLLGEIDLSAGTASGVCAAVMALALNHNGNLEQAIGGGTYTAIILGMVAALAVAWRTRLWWAAAIVASGLILLVTHQGSHQVVAIYLALATGTSIGLLTGFLVARVGIPSFVVTLGLFLGWQGVLLLMEGLGNSVPTRQYPLINGLANKNVPPLWGWIFLVVVVGGYVAYTASRAVRRHRAGIATEPVSLVLARAGTMMIIGIIVLLILNEERSPNPDLASLKGMPWVIPIILVLMIFWTLILAKSSWGRHLYAVGGNTAASARAGINTTRIRLSAFVICSSMAALGGVLLASKLGGVPLDAGGGNTLLFAVGAAVIGGTSLFGGRGRVRDGVLGAFVIAMIPNGLNLFPNISGAYVYILTALVLLIAATPDALARKRAATAGS